MSKESSLNRKEMIEEGNLEFQERNKNMINKNTGKILFSFFLWGLKIMFDGWRKKCHIIWCSSKCKYGK